MPPLPGTGGLPPRGESNASTTSTMTVRPPVLDVSVQPSLSRITSAGTVTSVLTVETQESPASETAGPQPQPSMSPMSPSADLIKPLSFTEARDVSCSSRDSLRRQLHKRRMSLTVQEQCFLDNLVIHGNEIEVQLAFERLQDDDLFFEHETPRCLNDQNGSSIGENQDFTLESTSFEPRDDPSISSHKSSIMKMNKNDDGASNFSQSAPPAVPAPRPTLERGTSHGSQRRMTALEQLKNSTRHSQLWKAHESGLAVTTNSSKMSLFRRTSSIGSKDSGPIGYQRSPLDAFRSRKTTPKKKQSISMNSLNSSDGRRASAPFVPQPHQRSQSMLMGSDVPPIPSPSRMARRDSTSSRKSVTFHAKTDGTPKPRPKTSMRMSSMRRSVSDSNALPPSTILGQPVERQDSVSSIPSLHHGHAIRQDSTSSIPSLHHGLPMCDDSISSIPGLHQGMPMRDDSVSSLPSLHHGMPMRDDSVSSFPSLHHGMPMREDSISSLPSLHHGMPMRDDSVSSLPSLHHGIPMRDDSVSSIPSIHHGLPIREDSVSSIPTLHHGHSIRRESMSSLPSLHHGHSIRQESISSIPSLHHGHAMMDDASRQSSVCQSSHNAPYAASNDIANAWLLGQGDYRRRASSTGSLPLKVLTIPSTGTTSSLDFTTSPESSNKRKNLKRLEDPFLSLPTPSSSASRTATTLSSSVDMDTNRPVLLRLASQNNDEGEGIEVSELPDQALLLEGDGSSAYFPSMISMDASVPTCTSFDTAMESYRHPDIFRNSVAPPIQRSLSDDDMGHLFLGPTTAKLLFRDTSGATYPNKQVSEYGEEDDGSWDMNSEDDNRYDSWNVIKDEYVNGYGGGDTLGFRILGTNVDDKSAQPHVLSPPLMESLQAFMPVSKSGQNFYLKYSMVRDGASLHSFLKRARGVQYSILALETIDGEVFGSFTGQPWRKNWNYFGTGESFLWRMRRSRLEKTHDILEQAELESEIDVYPYTGENRFIQLCTHDRIAVGGGTPEEKKLPDAGDMLSQKGDGEPLIKPHEWGFGLAIANDFMTGTTSPCVTFASPSLSKTHSDGSVFEIVNMELWTMTPCYTEEEAEKLELGKLFLARDY